MTIEIKKITNDMYEALKKPLPDEAVKAHPTKTFLSSIKAIYVTERLNEVFGCGAWSVRTEHITTTDKSMVVVKVTLTIPEYWVYYECFGGNDNGGANSKNFDLGDAFKGATTDAITKIGSYLGIGIDVFKGKHTHSTINKTDEKKDWFKQENLVAMSNVISSFASADEAVKKAREKYAVANKFADAIKHLYNTGEILNVK